MKSWFNAKELAGLSAMPATPQAVRRKAKREHWTARPRHGLGGGSEYHLGSLPEATQGALYIKYAPAPAKYKELAELALRVLALLREGFFAEEHPVLGKNMRGKKT